MQRMDELIQASIKMDTTLENIKSDLVQLRQKDIQILKQLIKISETIQQISKRQIQQRPLFNAKGYLCRVLMFVNPASLSVKVDTPMIRQQSVPAYCQMKESNSSTLTGSFSSIDDFDAFSSSDDSVSRISIETLQQEHKQSVNRQLSLPVPVSHGRPKSLSNTYFTRNEERVHDNDRRLEEMLMKNVKLWKQTQINDDDSVFLDDNLSLVYDK